MTVTRVLNLPSLGYARALALMRGLARARHHNRVGEVLILLEHPPVITLGRRAGEGELLLTRAELSRRGVEVHQVDRGGLATCHGPGQLVLYPVMSLEHLELGVVEFVRVLEEAVIRCLSRLGLESGRREGYPGVWVGGRKVAALGLSVRRGVTNHGLSLNNGIDLGLFDLINPCGLGSGRVTSLARLLGRPVEDQRLRRLLSGELAELLNLELEPWDLARAWEMVEKSAHAGS